MVPDGADGRWAVGRPSVAGGASIALDGRPSACGLDPPRAPASTCVQIGPRALIDHPSKPPVFTPGSGPTPPILSPTRMPRTASLATPPPMDRTKLFSRRRPVALLAAAAAGALAFAAPAVAAPAVATDTAMGTAADIARAQWGMDPCGGQVTVIWTILAPQVNATSTWSNPIGGYADPAENSSCKIEYNSCPVGLAQALHRRRPRDGPPLRARSQRRSQRRDGGVLHPAAGRLRHAWPGSAPGAPTSLAVPAAPASSSTKTSTSKAAKAKTPKVTKAKVKKAKTKKAKAKRARALAKAKKARAARARARARAKAAAAHRAAPYAARAAIVTHVA